MDTTVMNYIMDTKIQRLTKQVNDEIHDCVLTRKEPIALFACVNTQK